MKASEISHLAVIAILTAFPCALVADHIPGLYNTGVNDDTSIRWADVGNWEAHYRILPDGRLPSILRGYTGSGFLGAHSRAIGDDVLCGVPTGVYVFHTSFVVPPALNTNTVRLRGLWRTYGGPAGMMLLNNIPVATYTNDGLLDGIVPFQVSTGFVVGTNFLDFVVTNDGGCLLLEVDAIQGIALPAGVGYRAIPDLRDTGTLADKTLAPARSYDSAYRLLSAPAGVPLGAALVHWEANSPSSLTVNYYESGPYAQWIGPYANPETYAPTGLYHYRHSFNMTGLLPATAKLDGWCASDSAVEIRLNGVLATNIPASSDRRVYFAVTNGFTTGLNNLDFVVDNWRPLYSYLGSAALLVEGLQGSAKIDPDSPVLSIRVSQVQLSWDSATNVTYQVQSRSSLTTNEWVNYGGPVVGVDGVIRVDVPVLGDQSFYRLVTLP